jgi:apolipoprotein N-acyltransferase
MLNYNLFYDVYNSAIFINDSSGVDIYHKTKLVPGVEKMPFPKLLDPLVKFATDLGGIAGSLGKDNSKNYFLTNNFILKPLICYESVYGDLGAGKSSLISIITNDGWWKNTAGYKQHFSYASLRAIEQRRWIVRSANTGISGVINEKGVVVQKSEWDQSISLSSQVSVMDINTFYSIYGDYIGRISVFISLLLIMISFIKNKIKN